MPFLTIGCSLLKQTAGPRTKCRVKKFHGLWWRNKTMCGSWVCETSNGHFSPPSAYKIQVLNHTTLDCSLMVWARTWVIWVTHFVLNYLELLHQCKHYIVIILTWWVYPSIQVDSDQGRRHRLEARTCVSKRFSRSNIWENQVVWRWSHGNINI